MIQEKENKTNLHQRQSDQPPNNIEKLETTQEKAAATATKTAT